MMDGTSPAGTFPVRTLLRAWFSEHLSPHQGAELAKRYDPLCADFAESFEHTVEDIVANRHAELIPTLETGRGETPNCSSPSAKLSGMGSVNPVTLFFCTFQITVQKRNTISWGDAFVYEGGAFRLMGFGAWPFWAWKNGTEGAAAKRGSFGTPAILIHRVAPIYPPDARANNLEGVVVLHLFLDERRVNRTGFQFLRCTLRRISTPAALTHLPADAILFVPSRRL